VTQRCEREEALVTKMTKGCAVIYIVVCSMIVVVKGQPSCNFVQVGASSRRGTKVRVVEPQGPTFNWASRGDGAHTLSSSCGRAECLVAHYRRRLSRGITCKNVDMDLDFSAKRLLSYTMDHSQVC